MKRLQFLNLSFIPYLSLKLQNTVILKWKGEEWVPVLHKLKISSIGHTLVIVHEPSTYFFLGFFVNYKDNYRNVTWKNDIRTVVDIDPLLQLRSRVSLVITQMC
jgi:hypothetical protein